MNTPDPTKTAEIHVHSTSVAVRAVEDFSEFIAGCVRPREDGRLVTEMRRLELIPRVILTPEWRFFARGLAYVLYGKLLKAGFQVRVKGYLPTLVVNVCAAPGAAPMIEFIRSRLFGTIDLAGGGVSAAEAIAAVCVSFPRARIVVVTRYSAKPVIAELRALGLNVASVQHVRNFPGRYRVVVASIDNLGDVELGKADIVLAFEPYMTDRDDARRVNFVEPADVKKTCKWRSKLPNVRGRLFYIRTTSREFSPWGATGHAEAFGMASTRVCSPLGRRYARPVQVIMQPSKARLVIPSQQTPREVRHTAATCNVTLRRLALLVKAAARQDWTAVEKYLGRAGAMTLASIPSFRHLIYVGTQDAADSLARFLPSRDWPILDAESACQFEACGIIATEAGVRRIPELELDVIIRADFGPGLPPFPASWFTSTAPSTAPLCIIDYVAEQHPLLRRWTRSRQEAYLAADWREWGQHPAVHEYRRFLRAIAPRGAAR